MKTIILIIQLLIFTTVSFCQTYKDSTVVIKVTKYPEDSLLVIEINNTSTKNISIIQDIIIEDGYCPPDSCRFYASLWSYDPQSFTPGAPNPWSRINVQIIQAKSKHFLVSEYFPDDLIHSKFLMEYFKSNNTYILNSIAFKDVHNDSKFKNNLVRVEMDL